MCVCTRTLARTTSVPLFLAVNTEKPDKINNKTNVGIQPTIRFNKILGFNVDPEALSDTITQ